MRCPHTVAHRSSDTRAGGFHSTLTLPYGLLFVPLRPRDVCVDVAGHEVFFGKAPVPSDVHGYGKAAALLGYEPLDTLASFFAKL